MIYRAMSNRPYVSHLRSAAAANKRDDVVRAATRILREQVISSFSLDSVAKAAGVTRPTVYNQFGSRRGLLEAVLDEIARSGGLTRLPQAIDVDDSTAALMALVDVFCDFWGSDPAIARLHDAIALDAEFGEVLLTRNELRRDVVKRIIRRMSLPSQAAKSDVIDLIFALTSYAMYRMVASAKSDKAARRIIKAACLDALKRLQPQHADRK